MHNAFDAAFPPLKAPPGYGLACGYLGDAGNTPHVWTRAEWLRFAVSCRYLPIWTYNPTRPAADQAGDCLLRLHQLGINSTVRRYGRKWRNVVALDLETAKVKIADVQFTNILHMAGFLVMPYGSLDSVFANPGDFYWVADWEGHTPHMVAGDNVGMTQWTDGDPFDKSLVRWKLWRHLQTIP